VFFTKDQLPEQVREVRTGAPAQRVPAPHPRIDIEQLVAAITQVQLVFDFDDASIAKLREQAPGRLLDLRPFNRFNVGTGTTEVHRVLPRALRYRPCKGVPIQAQRRVRELSVATARD